LESLLLLSSLLLLASLLFLASLLLLVFSVVDGVTNGVTMLLLNASHHAAKTKTASAVNIELGKKASQW
jgi:hypothetical protein